MTNQHLWRALQLVLQTLGDVGDPEALREIVLSVAERLKSENIQCFTMQEDPWRKKKHGITDVLDPEILGVINTLCLQLRKGWI